MNHRPLIFCVLLGTGLLSWPTTSTAEEPFFRFLDDFDGSRPRDPYEERIETERHDFTQSTITVGKGVFQHEGGYTFFYVDDGHEIETTHTFPELLLRYGLTEDIEIRMKTNYAGEFLDRELHSDGAEDLRLGLKLGMTEHERFIPESAMELAISVPTGGSDWSTGDTRFGVDYIYGWELSERVTIYGSTGAFQNALGDWGFAPDDPAADDFVAMTQSGAVGIHLSHSSTLYLEVYSIHTSQREDNVNVAVFNTGLDFYISDNVVLDFRLGTGLTEDSEDLVVGVGGGYRY